MVLKKNTAVELGVCNGNSAVVVDWIENPEEPAEHQVVDGIRILKRCPVAVYLQFDRNFQLPGLPKGVACVKPTQEEITSEDGKIKAKRLSFAMQLRENTTAYGVQGKTLPMIAVDDRHSAKKDSHFSNVAYTRVKTLEALRILQFDPDASRKSAAKGLAEMNVWMKAVRDKTALAYGHVYRPNPHPPLPNQSFAGYNTAVNRERLQKLRDAAAALKANAETPHSASRKRKANRPTPQPAKRPNVDDLDVVAFMLEDECDMPHEQESNMSEDEEGLALLREGFLDC